METLLLVVVLLTCGAVGELRLCVAHKSVRMSGLVQGHLFFSMCKHMCARDVCGVTESAGHGKSTHGKSTREGQEPLHGRTERHVAYERMESILKVTTRCTSYNADRLCGLALILRNEVIRSWPAARVTQPKFTAPRPLSNHRSDISSNHGQGGVMRCSCGAVPGRGGAVLRVRRSC